MTMCRWSATIVSLPDRTVSATNRVVGSWEATIITTSLGIRWGVPEQGGGSTRDQVKDICLECGRSMIY